ncbi:hypothetical protein [Flavobacterium sp. N2038]|uniref:hypothetical protein n=1 Tax=Flavobacterium sp. N2038 TaxID=2986829 RepID=UPI002224A703|nr:hypothetical protein [Flavobacterium sp. N2038]
MKIHFYHHNLIGSIDELNFSPNDGLDHWITTTFFALKMEFEEITIGPEIPLEGVIVFHRRYFPAKIKPTINQFFLCLHIDSGRHSYAQWHIVHNPYQDKFFLFPKLITDFLFGFSKTKFICGWPQHNMIPREISRKRDLKTISFHGNIENIPKEVISDDFNMFLKNNNLELKIKAEPESWNDFSDSDLSFCFRSFDNEKYYFKPYLKITNSLLAGVPVVSGYDSSSVYFHNNYVTIPLVRNISELKVLILQIVEKKYDPIGQLEEFEKHKNKFVRNEIQKKWILLLKQVEQDYNKWMSSSNNKRTAFLKVRQFYRFMYNSSKLYFTFLVRIKSKIRNFKILVTKCA